MVCDGLPQRQRRSAFCGGRAAEVELGTLEKQPLKERLIWSWSCLQPVSLWVWSCFCLWISNRVLLSTSWISRGGSFSLSLCCWKKLWLFTAFAWMIAFIHHHSSCISICFILINNINAKSIHMPILIPPASKKGSPFMFVASCSSIFSSHGCFLGPTHWPRVLRRFCPAHPTRRGHPVGGPCAALRWASLWDTHVTWHLWNVGVTWV